MTTTISGTLIAQDLQLTLDVLALFRDGHLAVADQQQHLEEVDLMAASVLFGLGGRLQTTDQNSPFIQLPTDDRRKDDVDAFGPSGVADKTTADYGSLQPLEPCLGSKSPAADVSEFSLTPPVSPEDIALGTNPHDVASTSFEDDSEGIMSTCQLEEVWFDFEKYRGDSHTELTATASGSPTSWSPRQASPGTDIDSANHSDSETSARREDVNPDDEVVFIGTQPAKKATHVDQDDDIVIVDIRSINPTLGRADRVMRKRCKANRCIAPYAHASRRGRRLFAQTAANLNRWRDFTALWSEIHNVAMEDTGLSSVADFMEGIVITVDDDRDFRLWGDVLKENWDKLSDKVGGYGVEFERKFGQAGKILKEILGSC